MATQVLDSSNLQHFAETGEVLPIAEVVADNEATAAAGRGESPADKEGEKPAKAEAQPKKGVRANFAPDPAPGTDPDDLEGADGLTPREKRDLSAKMQSAVGKRVARLREAEEFATDQYNTRVMAERRAEQLEREVQRLKAQAAPPTADVKPADEGKPVREKFETDEAFRDALDDWRVENKFRAREAEAQKQRETDRTAEILRVAGERIDRAKELKADFAEVVAANDWKVPGVIAGYMQESELFAELGYFLALPENEEVRTKLEKLTPARQLVEIGKIESRLQPFAASTADENDTHGDKPSPSTNGTKPSTETAKAQDRPRAVPAPVIRPLSTSSALENEKSPADRTVQDEVRLFQKRKGTHLTRRARH